MNKAFIMDFSDAIGISPELIRDDLDLQSLGGWDSLSCLSAISLIDRYFHILLNNDDLVSVRYFGDLKEVIHKKAKLIDLAG